MQQRLALLAHLLGRPDGEGGGLKQGGPKPYTPFPVSGLAFPRMPVPALAFIETS